MTVQCTDHGNTHPSTVNTVSVHWYNDIEVSRQRCVGVLNVQTVKSLTEAIKRLEANARDSALEDPASASRSLQHSLSCGTIIVDPRSSASGATNGMTLATHVAILAVGGSINVLLFVAKIHRNAPIGIVNFKYSETSHRDRSQSMISKTPDRLSGYPALLGRPYVVTGGLIKC